MNSKLIIIATVAALSLATTAFAGEGNGVTTPFATSSGFSAAPPLVVTGSAQYQTYVPGQIGVTAFNNTVLPERGQNGPVETANSLPRGFEDGTPEYMVAQSTNYWFAQQAEHRFAQQQQALAAHRRG